MKIKFASLPVADQDKALAFYTDLIGLTKAADIDMGPMRFLTLAGEDGIEGGQIILEALDFPPLAAYQRARYEAGIPILSLNTSDVAADHARLSAKGVAFRDPVQDLGPILSAVFDDTCGNLIHLVQAKG